MNMEQITLYLKKFENFVPHERQVRDAIAEILSRHIGCRVPLNAIHVRGSTVFITASPSFKNTVFLYKEKIILELTEKLRAKVSVKDVR